ncbi:MAG: hypothetical protein CVT89_01715, partial [Candidatus Altiarchaeales archaeon HGW-Altiarchaeales-2]
RNFSKSSYDEFERKVKDIIEKEKDIEEELKKLEEMVKSIEVRLKSIEENYLKYPENFDPNDIIEALRGNEEKIGKIESDIKQLYDAGVKEILTEKQFEKEFEYLIPDIIKEESGKMDNIIKESDNRAVIITGEPGIGKSTLLFLLFKKLKKVYKLIGTEFYSLHGRYLFYDSRNILKDDDEFIRAIFRKQAKNVIFAIRKPLLEKIKNKFSEGGEFEKVFSIIEIKYSKEFLKDLLNEKLKKNGIKADEYAINKIIEKSEGNTLYITTLVDELKNKGIKEISREIAEKLPAGIKKLIKQIMDDSFIKGGYKGDIIIMALLSRYEKINEYIFESLKNSLNSLSSEFKIWEIGSADVTKYPYYKKIGNDFLLPHPWWNEIIKELLSGEFKNIYQGICSSLEASLKEKDYQKEISSKIKEISKINILESDVIERLFFYAILGHVYTSYKTDIVEEFATEKLKTSAEIGSLRDLMLKINLPSIVKVIPFSHLTLPEIKEGDKFFDETTKKLFATFKDFEDRNIEQSKNKILSIDSFLVSHDIRPVLHLLTCSLDEMKIFSDNEKDWKYYLLKGEYEKSINTLKTLYSSNSDPELLIIRGIVYEEWHEYGHKAENCKNAIKCYEEALKIRTIENFPMQYATTQNNLGNAYKTLGKVENKAKNCKNAIKCYEEALKIYTIVPMQYAGTQNNLGIAYGILGEVENKAENCKNAIKCYEEALKIRTIENFPMEAGFFISGLGWMEHIFKLLIFIAQNGNEEEKSDAFAIMAGLMQIMGAEKSQIVQLINQVEIEKCSRRGKKIIYALKGEYKEYKIKDEVDLMIALMEDIIKNKRESNAI